MNSSTPSLERMTSSPGSSEHVILSELGSDEENSVTIMPSTNDNDDVHRALSPATPFESFFLSPQLRTNNISAYALASQIRSSARSSAQSLTSIATDEFGTACETTDDWTVPPPTGNLFGKDVLVISREPIPEVSLEYEDSIMTDEQQHFDVTQHVYEGVKGIWAGVKAVPIFKPFMQLYEGIANKVVSVAGTSLAEIDGNIKPKLAEFDNTVVTPSIQKIVDILMAAGQKGETTFGPVIDAILKPLGIKKIEPQKQEPAPEVTQPAPVMTKKSSGGLGSSLGNSMRMSLSAK